MDASFQGDDTSVGLNLLADACNMQINIFHSRNYQRLSDAVGSSVASRGLL
jgi:hypothetical protein